MDRHHWLLRNTRHSPALFIGMCVVLGLLVGSFLNVVIHRVPIMMDNELRAECAALAAAGAGSEPPSRRRSTSSRRARPARSARRPITALQNIPVVSWLALRRQVRQLQGADQRALSAGGARHRRAVGLRRLALRLRLHGAGRAGVHLAADRAHDDRLRHAVPARLAHLSAAVAGAAREPLAPGLGCRRAARSDLREAIIGAVAGYLSLWSVYWLFKLITGKEGMGYGDFKLFAALGAWLGWRCCCPSSCSPPVSARCSASSCMIRQRKGRDTQIAFGPFLAVAGWLALVAGHDIVSTLSRPSSVQRS